MEVVIRILVDIVVGWNLISGGMVEGTDNPEVVGNLLEDHCYDVTIWTWSDQGYWDYYSHRNGNQSFDYIDKDRVYWIRCWSYEESLQVPTTGVD